jgi:hypothetical protein
MTEHAWGDTMVPPSNHQEMPSLAGRVLSVQYKTATGCPTKEEFSGSGAQALCVRMYKQGSLGEFHPKNNMNYGKVSRQNVSQVADISELSSRWLSER